MSATSYNTKKKKPPSLFSQLQDHHYTACGDLSVSAESLSRKVGASGRRGPRSSQGRGRGNENGRGSNQGGSLGRGATRGRGATTGWGTTGGQSATGGQGASAGRSVTSRRGATSGRDAHSGRGATSGRGTHSGRVIERGNLDNGSARESSHPVRDALGRTNGSRGRGGTGHNNDGRGAGRNLRHQGATNGQPSNGSQNSFGSGVGRSDAEDGPNRYKRKIYCKLSDWLDKPADVTVLEVNKDDQAILQKFLSDALSSDKNMCVFVEILSTACKSFSCQQGILDIFSAVFTEKFVKKLSKCQLTYSSLKNGELKRFLKHQHLLLSRYFQAMPMRALDTIPELLKTIHEHLDALQERELIQQDVAEELELYKKLLERFSAQMEARTKRTEKAKLNNDMIVEFAALSVQDPEEDFRMVPIEPSYDDIFASNEPSLRQNIVEGKFADVSTYLDVQFRLLREDFIRPLREGINNFANNTLTKNQNITICKGMKVIKAEIDRGKLIYSVQLQTKKKLNLENSKKFMTGNLVCVTEDNFASFTLAVIADTKLDALKLGIISLTPLNDGKLNFTTLYTLVESPAFFVAYKHVLAALQRMDQDCFPLAEHIVHVQARVDPPCYLEARPNPRYDLTVVLDVSYMKDTSTNSIFGKALSKSPPETSLSNVRVTSGMECWPSNEDFGLDESQLQALHAALTSRLAIIQGPPGTGKTYLGLKIVQCLLHNSATWTNDEKSSRKSTKFGSKPPAQPPILVICFKNHSLDQFLERMLKFTSKIVRIGGRGENEAIEKLKVTEILQRLKTEKKSPSYLSQAGASLYRKLNDITKRYKEMQTRIMKISQKNGLLRWEVLKSHNIVAPHVAEQFSNVSYRDWILPNDEDMQQSAPSTPLLSIWENDAISTTEELLSNEEAEECEELWLDALETTRVEEHQRFLDDDASTIFDGEIADEVERSDGDFELLTEDLIQELEDTVASEHAPALTKRRLQLENQLECLKRLSAFTKVDVSALELFGDQNVHQLCFQDRCLLYATWRHNLRTKYQKEVTMRETKIQRLGEQGSMNSAMFGALTWEIRRYQSSLAGLATLEGVISWDCLIYNGIIPPYTLKQLSIHLYLLWLLPCDPEFSTVPITKPMWTIWKSCKEGSCITDKKDDVLWRARMERARYEVPVTDSDPLDPHFFDIRSNDQEFEVLVENYDQKLTEMEFMVNQNLTREDYELHSASLRREQECLKRVSMIATKNVTNLKLKDDVDVQTLSFVDRCLLYATWKQKLISEYEKKSRVYEKMTPQLTAEMEEIKLARYLYVARQAHVVGLTTTGAATYQALIEDLHPKIVIVEEAAEVLEGHVVASLTKSCEHLIMIGDHQQLRPSTAVYELAIKYGLETSLFERMINNGLEYQTLQHQHRMRPEISCLLVPTIYPTLKDASSVEGRDEIRGLTSSVFFVSHGQLERQGTDENMSRSNVHEADFIVELASHLVLQGYLPDEITVLTPYSGQALLLKKGLERIPECKTVHVSIVDGYQGQENKIILLSLVRSNDTGQVGFLKTENRVCVALSRARDGLFIIGNMEQLCRSGPLWKKINRSLRETDSVGEALTLRCENHPEQVNQVIKAADFKKYSPEGGCKLPCLKKLPSCGHTCPRICHVVDSTHEKMKCMENVLKYCERGSHKYKYHCSENRTCMKKIKIKLPQCQHIKEITCSADETEEKCTAQCSEVLDCGHVCQQPCHFDNDPDHEQYVCRAPCSLKAKGCYADHTCPRECWKDCSSCEVKVHKIAKCGHSVTVKCSFDMTEYTCRNLCRRLLECKHKCPRKCWEKCGGCNMMVEKILPVCKHTVKLACNADLTGFLCQEPCDRRFECEHKCSRKCSEECRTCLQKVTKTLPECGHTALVPCEEDASGYPCTMPCERILPCGHRCLLKCSEKCSGRNCSTIVCKERTCGHSVLLVECSYSMLAYKCQLPCERIMQCGHRCLRDCWEECGGCQEPVKKVLGQCGHLVEVPCCSDPINADCDEPCQRILNCGHRCPKPCYAPCTTLCREPRSSVEKCFAGHVAQLPCYISTERDDAAVAAVSEACKAACSAILECGHTCSGSCSSCLHGRLHQPCREPCKRRLLCGHRCQTVCGEPCPPCSQRCHRCCPHMRCASKCAEPCSKCPRECGFVCPHARGCGKDCSECKCVPCLFACPKILPCGHACVGYCGDPCPSLCRVCDGDQLKKSCLRAMVPEELAVARFVLLPDCGDTFEYNGLRTWLRMPDDNVSTKRCPLCRANIFNCQRFEKYIKKFYKSAHQALVVYKTSIKPISTIADLIKDNDSGQVLSSLLSINVICNSPLVQSVQEHLDGRADTIPAQELIKFHFQAAFIVTAGSMLTNLTPKKDLLNLLKKVLEQELVPANQFRQEVSCEMQRIGFLDTLSTMRSSAPPELLPRITAVLHQHLAPTKPFTSAREWHVYAFLLQLKNVTPKLKFTTRRMDSSELTARTMCNGAWFTCPKGHVLFRMPDEKESVCMGCLNPKKKSCIVM